MLPLMWLPMAMLALAIYGGGIAEGQVPASPTPVPNGFGAECFRTPVDRCNTSICKKCDKTAFKYCSPADTPCHTSCLGINPYGYGYMCDWIQDANPASKCGFCPDFQACLPLGYYYGCINCFAYPASGCPNPPCYPGGAPEQCCPAVNGNGCTTGYGCSAAQGPLGCSNDQCYWCGAVNACVNNVYDCPDSCEAQSDGCIGQECGSCDDLGYCGPVRQKCKTSCRELPAKTCKNAGGCNYCNALDYCTSNLTCAANCSALSGDPEMCTQVTACHFCNGIAACVDVKTVCPVPTPAPLPPLLNCSGLNCSDPTCANVSFRCSDSTPFECLSGAYAGTCSPFPRIPSVECTACCDVRTCPPPTVINCSDVACPSGVCGSAGHCNAERSPFQCIAGSYSGQCSPYPELPYAECTACCDTRLCPPSVTPQFPANYQVLLTTSATYMQRPAVVSSFTSKVMVSDDLGWMHWSNFNGSSLVSMSWRQYYPAPFGHSSFNSATYRCSVAVADSGDTYAASHNAIGGGNFVNSMLFAWLRRYDFTNATSDAASGTKTMTVSGPFIGSSFASNGTNLRNATVTLKTKSQTIEDREYDVPVSAHLNIPTAALSLSINFEDFEVLPTVNASALLPPAGCNRSESQGHERRRHQSRDKADESTRARTKLRDAASCSACKAMGSAVASESLGDVQDKVCDRVAISSGEVCLGVSALVEELTAPLCVVAGMTVGMGCSLSDFIPDRVADGLCEQTGKCCPDCGLQGTCDDNHVCVCIPRFCGPTCQQPCVLPPTTTTTTTAAPLTSPAPPTTTPGPTGSPFCPGCNSKYPNGSLVCEVSDCPLGTPYYCDDGCTCGGPIQRRRVPGQRVDQRLVVIADAAAGYLQNQKQQQQQQPSSSYSSSPGLLSSLAASCAPGDYCGTGVFFCQATQCCWIRMADSGICGVCCADGSTPNCNFGAGCSCQ